MNSVAKITASVSLICILIILPLIGVYYLHKPPYYHEESDCFKAAVFDHYTWFDPLDDMGTNMEINFQAYVNVTKIAKENDVRVLVFPESSLMITRKDPTREYVLQHALIVPDGTYCDKDIAINNVDQYFYNDSVPMLERMSCLAKHFQMYITFQLLENKPCQYGKDKGCREDGHYLFNAAIMFNPNGKLIAKYHKMQLYAEMLRDPAPNDELVYVDTEYGRFGFMLCFDAIYNKPAHVMATNSSYSVDHIIFPTHWYNGRPFLPAGQYQMSWAFGNQVNLLACDRHEPLASTVGSGIYLGGQELSFINSNFYTDTGSRLVIARIPKHPRSLNRFRCSKDENKIIQIDIMGKKPEYEEYRCGSANLTNVLLKALDKDSMENVTLKHNGITCKLTYKAENLLKFYQNNLNSGKYFFIASNRTTPGVYPYDEEFCAIIFCADDHCKNIVTNDEELFKYVQLIGTFSEETFVYPSIAGYQDKPIDPDNGNVWRFSVNKPSSSKGVSTRQHFIEFGSSSSSSSKGIIKTRKLSTLGLFGRPYKRDPPYKLVPLP